MNIGINGINKAWNTQRQIFYQDNIENKKKNINKNVAISDNKSDTKEVN